MVVATGSSQLNRVQLSDRRELRCVRSVADAIVRGVRPLLLIPFVLGLASCGAEPERRSVDASSSGMDAGGDAGSNPELDAAPSDAETTQVADAQRTEAALTADAAPVDAGPTRRSRLATTGAQLIVTGPELGLSLTEAEVVADSDVIALHQEFYGFPWDAFESESTPPIEWTRVMDRLADSARASKKPVFLSVTMLNGLRESLAPKTRIEQGQVKTTDNWSARCYDFARAPDGAQKRAAYLRYVAWMVSRFEPAYLNIAIEVNLFLEKCPDATPALIDLTNEVYRAVKKQRPDTVVFPSFQIDHLYGYSDDSCPAPMQRDQCFDRLYAVIKPILRDRFAISTYPFMAGFKSATEVPADWFTRGAARGKEMALIAETGWISSPVTVRGQSGVCQTWFTFDEAISAAYLARALSDAERAPLELVTWWSDRDLLVEPLMTDCPCDFDTTWCAVLDIFRGPPSAGAADTQAFGELLLKIFGTMGIRRYDGTPKPQHMMHWSRARALPYAP
jgi:hypothetical protein